MDLDNLENKGLGDLFKLADEIGKKRYHKLTSEDWDEYKKFEQWRYINGNSECGTTPESQEWVKNHSDYYCPICGEMYKDRQGRSIDHKLPRAQYPWLSMDFRNLWVICWMCNKEKGEMHWFEYERYILTRYPHRYAAVRDFRPTKLLTDLSRKDK